MERETLPDLDRIIAESITEDALNTGINEKI